jgi:hypothetical protein
VGLASNVVTVWRQLGLWLEGPVRSMSVNNSQLQDHGVSPSIDVPCVCRLHCLQATCMRSMYTFLVTPRYMFDSRTLLK